MLIWYVFNCKIKLFFYLIFDANSGMVIAAENHSPGRRCHIDTLMDVLKAAGNYVRDDVIFNTIQLVSESSELQPYVVHETWKAIRDTENCTEKQPLTQVSCWCIGNKMHLDLAVNLLLVKVLLPFELVLNFHYLLCRRIWLTFTKWSFCRRRNFDYD